MSEVGFIKVSAHFRSELCIKHVLIPYWLVLLVHIALYNARVCLFLLWVSLKQPFLCRNRGYWYSSVWKSKSPSSAEYICRGILINKLLYLPTIASSRQGIVRNFEMFLIYISLYDDYTPAVSQNQSPWVINLVKNTTNCVHRSFNFHTRVTW